MTSQLPLSLIGQKRSAFSLIDPQTELYHHKIGRAQHVAISYVWGDWTSNPEAGHHLRHWPVLRQRLLKIVGPEASQFMKIESGNASRCWLDCKCINQESEGDKKYWVPRMDEIYSEARCTVLLLRGINLSCLKEAEGRLACDLDDDNHNCSITQSCVTMTLLGHDLKTRCIEALREIQAGAWRKRAWIFQEILLSREYILSGEDHAEIKLADAGTLAYLLFQLHPQEVWLGELASWCRRLFRLRLYYFNYQICPSNILQLASSLEATLPCDKYYALSGLLRLKGLSYDSSHTERQALEAVILALTKSGRLSWLSAIPPGLTETIPLDMEFLPYVERHLDRGMGSFYANTKASDASLIRFSSIEIGSIVRIRNALEVLQEAMPYANAHNISENLPTHIAALPALLLTVCRESIETLTVEPILGRLCQILEVPKGRSNSSVLLMRLLAISNPKSFTARQDQNRKVSVQDLELVAASAWSIQYHVKSILRSVDFVEWSLLGKPERRYYAAGSKGCKLDDSICAVEGDSLLFAIRLKSAEATSSKAGWVTVLHQPASPDDGLRFKSVGAGPIASIRAKWNGWKQRTVVFSLS